jgi:hypothetical protein
VRATARNPGNARLQLLLAQTIEQISERILDRALDEAERMSAPTKYLRDAVAGFAKAHRLAKALQEGVDSRFTAAG